MSIEKVVHELSGELDISDVARAAGVTSRTLRHYDAIGLVPATSTDISGRRRYGREALLRLQRVLIMRSLGVPLPRIAEVLAEQTTQAEALRRHRDELVDERDRLSDVIETVDRTLTHLAVGTPMTIENIFAGLPGFEAEKQLGYRAEAMERWGEDVVTASDQRARGLTRDQAAGVLSEHDVIAAEAAQLALAGAPLDSEETQALVARHYAWVCTFWTPDAEAYEGLGQMYVDDERFRATYDAHGQGAAVYLCDAMAVFARTTLATSG